MDARKCCLVAVASLVFTTGADAQTLRAGSPEHLPGITIANGNFTSALRDGLILQCVVQSAELNLNWVQYPTARLLKMANAGEFDILYPMGFDSQRDIELQRSLFTLKARDFWVFSGISPDFNDKSGITVAAKLGSPQQDYLQQNGYRNISLPNSYASLFKMVEGGHVMAIAVPESIFITMKPSLGWTASVQTYFERDVGFYVSKTLSPSVLERINRAIPGCRR